MIVVISENKASSKLDKWRSLGYVINHDELQSRQTSYHKVDWSLILNRNTTAVVVELHKFYNSTKQKIWGALQRSPVIIINNKQVIRLNSLDDLECTSTYWHSLEFQFKTKRFNLLDQLFEEHYLNNCELEDINLNQQLISTFEPTKETLLKWCGVFEIPHPNNELERRQASAQIEFYIQNDMVPEYETLLRYFDEPPHEIPSSAGGLWRELLAQDPIESQAHITVGLSEVFDTLREIKQEEFN